MSCLCIVNNMTINILSIYSNVLLTVLIYPEFVLLLKLWKWIWTLQTLILLSLVSFTVARQRFTLHWLLILTDNVLIFQKKNHFLCIINNFDNTNQFVCRTKYLDKCKRKYFMLHGSFACTIDELVWGIGWRIVSGNSSVCMKEELQEKRCVVWNSFVIVIFYVLPRAKFTLHIFSKSIRFLKPSNIFIIFFSLFYIIHSLRTLCFAFLKTLNLLFKQGVVKFLSEYNYMQSTSFLSIMMKNIIFLGIIFFFTFYLECFLQQFSIVLYKHYIFLLFVERDSQRLNIIFIL